MNNTKQYYRNKVEIKGVDPDSLWELKGNLLVLVDEDQYITVSKKKIDLFYLELK